MNKVIDWFKWHVNPFKFISVLEVRESRSLYIFINIFCLVVSKKVWILGDFFAYCIVNK